MQVEKISILGDTIKYLKKLETRVEELESYMEVTGPEARKRSLLLKERENNSNKDSCHMLSGGGNSGRKGNGGARK